MIATTVPIIREDKKLNKIRIIRAIFGGRFEQNL